MLPTLRYRTLVLIAVIVLAFSQWFWRLPLAPASTLLAVDDERSVPVLAPPQAWLLSATEVAVPSSSQCLLAVGEAGPARLEDGALALASPPRVPPLDRGPRLSEAVRGDCPAPAKGSALEREQRNVRAVYRVTRPGSPSPSPPPPPPPRPSSGEDVGTAAAAFKLPGHKENKKSVASQLVAMEERLQRLKKKRRETKEAPLRPRRDMLPVLVVIVDSTSRAAAMRDLPRGVRQFLESPPSTHDAFVFNRLLAQPGTTAANLTPLLFGRRFRAGGPEETLRRTKMLFRPPVLLKNDSLTYYFGQEGYASIFSSSPASLFGGVPGFDRSFFGFDVEAPSTTAGFRFVQSKNCTWPNAGGRRVCDWKAGFIADVWRAYAHDTPLLGWLHFNEAHDSVNTRHAEVLDRTLDVLVRQVLDAAPDTVIFLLTDHGNPGAAREVYLPLFSVLLPRALASRPAPQQGVGREHGGRRTVADVARENQDRVMSAFDAHASLLHLLAIMKSTCDDGASSHDDDGGGGGGGGDCSGAAATPSLPAALRQLNKAWVGEPVPLSEGGEARAVSIFDEVIPRDRTCAESNVPWHSCPCKNAFDVVQLSQEQSKSLVAAVAENLNAMPGIGEAPCRPFELSSMKIFDVRAVLLPDSGGGGAAAAGGGGGGQKLGVQARVTAPFPQGLPGVQLFLHALATRSTESGALSHISIEALRQLSAFRPNEACTPKGVSPEFCVCRAP